MVVADAPYVIDQVTAALGGSDVGFTIVTEGRAVAGLLKTSMPDLAVIDLQVGSMGGMAITMAARLDESAGAHARLPVILLLDRQADVHLAKRCDADVYLIKPINALHLKRAARQLSAAPVELDERSRADAAKRGRRPAEVAANGDTDTDAVDEVDALG